jgi:hypothetical protein
MARGGTSEDSVRPERNASREALPMDSLGAQAGAPGFDSGLNVRNAALHQVRGETVPQDVTDDTPVQFHPAAGRDHWSSEYAGVHGVAADMARFGSRVQCWEAYRNCHPNSCVSRGDFFARVIGSGA